MKNDLEVDLQNELGRILLLALLRGEKKVVVPQESWQTVIKLAVRHGVSELLYQQLTRQEETIASAHLHDLRKNYLISTARNSFFYHELSNVLAILDREHIPVIVLKGSFLAERIYGNISVRPMGDIDLLVVENDLMRVDALLLGLGYHRQFISMQRSAEEHALPYNNAQNGLVIEIHWVLMNAMYGMQADIHQLWQRARPTTIANQPVLELTPEDQILHLCIHTSVHVFQMGLRALCDLNATLHFYRDAIDWDCLQQRARQWRAERCVYLNLRLSQALLHSPLATDWLNTIQPEGFEERYYLLAQEHLFKSVEVPDEALPGAVGVIRFWATADWGRKVHILLRRVFPSREEMARMYPAPPDSLRIFLFYPARLIDLLHRFGQLGGQLILGKGRTIGRAKRQNEINDLRDWMIIRKP